MDGYGDKHAVAPGWGLDWLWAAIGLADREPEPEPEPELVEAGCAGGKGSTGGSNFAEQQDLPGVAGKVAQTEQLLARLVGDWDVRGLDASGFLSLDEKFEDGEPRTLVGELSLEDATFEIYGVAAISLPRATVWLKVATGELEHVYAEFEGRLELRFPDSGPRLEISVHMDAPEGHSKHHVAGDMSGSQVRLEWHALEGVRAD